MTAQLGRIRPVKAAELVDSVRATQRRSGQARHVFSLLKYLARFGGVAPAAIDAIAVDGKIRPSREAICDVSQRLGLDARLEDRRLETLAPNDCPVIALTTEGLGFLIVDVKSRGVVEVAVDGDGRETVNIDDLVPHYVGTLARISLGQPFEEPGRVSAVANQQSLESPRDQTQSTIKAIVSDVLSGQRSLVLQLFLAAVLANLLAITVPLFIMAVYDRIIPHLAFETLWALVLGVMIALSCDFGVRFVRMRVTDAIALTASRRTQSRILARIMGSKRNDQPKSSAEVNQALQDVDQVTHLVPVTLVAILVDLPFFLFLLGLISYLGGWVVLAPLFGAAFLFALNLGNVSGVRAAGAVVAQSTLRRANAVDEIVEKGDTVRLSGIRLALQSRLERMVDGHSMALHGSRVYGAFPAVLAMSVNQLAVVFTLIIGVYQVAAGAMTVGTLAAVTILVGRAIGPVGSLAGLLAKARLLGSTMENVLTLDRLEMERGGDVRGAPTPVIKGQIDLHGVSYQYPDAEKPALGPLSLSIKEGERVGLIGPIGCGKSSLLRLVPRLMDPTDGTVLIDGYSVSQYDPDRLRSSVSFMTQASELMAGTLYDNLVAGVAKPDDRFLEHCAELTGLKDIIARHPQGFGMQIGGRTSALSVGEQQIIALTRCLFRNAPILLMDEPTAAFDNRLEKQIVERLDEMFSGKTVIVATHRAPLLNLVDRIIVMDRGKIVSDKPRDTLLPMMNGGQPPESVAS
ncbi:MAG: ATP-binding cassette domain-containing protein [Pseudomonadota bacterium]